MEANLGKFDLACLYAVLDRWVGTVLYWGVVGYYVCAGVELKRIYLEGAIRRVIV